MTSTPQDSGDNYVQSLSKTQKRRSIGETAKREKKALSTASPHINRSKTLVVHPKEIEWPVVIEELNTKLLSKLKEALTILKSPVGKPSLKDIREVPKGDRKQFRKKFRGEEAVRLGLNLSDYFKTRSSLAIGVNCVSKQLEKDQLSAVLIDPDVDPPIMTKLLVPMAKGKSVPAIAVKGLESAISLVSGISCVALGLKKCCKEESHLLHSLLDTIQNSLTFESSPLLQATSDSSTPISGYKPTKIRKLNS